jgi:hypothetical protein
MVDSGRPDDKIVAVALNDPEYTVYSDINQLPPFKLLMINQFFNDYRVLERKRVKTSKPAGSEQARDIIRKSLKAYGREFPPSGALIKHRISYPNAVTGRMFRGSRVTDCEGSPHSCLNQKTSPFQKLVSL